MRHSLRLTAAALSAGLLLAGCGGVPNDKNSDASKLPYQIALDDGYDPNAEFRYGYNSFVNSWDPIESLNGGVLIFYAPVYDRLLWVDEDGNFEPMLATAYTPSADLTSMTLELREGLTFSDGTPFDAEAVKFNLDRSRAQGSTLAGELYQVKDVEVIDPLTVKINVDGGLSSLAAALASRPGIMVSPAAAQAGTLKATPTGIGPYVTTEIAPGDHVVYEKVDGYWDPDAQRVAKRTYRSISDDQTRFNALQAGELDGASLSPALVDNVRDAGLATTTRPSGLFLFLAFNTSVAPFDDPEVMKAINMAVDRKGISEGLYEGLCVPQIQPFAEGLAGYSKKVGDGLDVFPYDPGAAKKLLAKAGATDLKVSAVNSSVSIYTKFAEVVQADMKEIGIDFSLSTVAGAQLSEDFSIKKSADATPYIYAGLADPSGVVGSFLAPTAPFNPGGAQYDELLKLAKDGAAQVDPVERDVAYEKMIDAWVEAPPHVVPVCMIHLAAGFAKNVSGVLQTAGGITDLLRGVAVTND